MHEDRTCVEIFNLHRGVTVIAGGGGGGGGDSVNVPILGKALCNSCHPCKDTKGSGFRHRIDSASDKDQILVL